MTDEQPPPAASNGSGRVPGGLPNARGNREQTLSEADQTASDANQTAADLDQTISDADQDSSQGDQAASNADQRASDRDQKTADDEEEETRSDDPIVQAWQRDRQASRAERAQATMDRARTTVERTQTAIRRLNMADERDLAAQSRDIASVGRDYAATARDRLADVTRYPASAARQRAAEDRGRAADDRARAAEDRVVAATDRDAIRDALEDAHIDDLTGTFRRAMGTVALQGEIDRAHRHGTGLVLAFVDVDDLKACNDRDGHAAGDELLLNVVTSIRGSLRSYDPVVRFGGDEFICALCDANLDEAKARFDHIAESLAQVSHGASITVGFAELGPDDSLRDLIERGDKALYGAKSSGPPRGEGSPPQLEGAP